MSSWWFTTKAGCGFRGIFWPDPSLLTWGMGTWGPVLAHLRESRWCGHLRACLPARDESCSRQSGRSLFADSFPSGLWIQLMVHVEPWLAGKGDENQLPHEGSGVYIKHQQKKKRPRISFANLREAFHSWVQVPRLVNVYDYSFDKSAFNSQQDHWKPRSDNPTGVHLNKYIQLRWLKANSFWV